MEKEIIERVNKIPLNKLMEDVWPPSLCLMRDCYWIAFRETEDIENAYTQEGSEDFEDFVKRVIASELENEKPYDDGFMYLNVDFAIAEAECNKALNPPSDSNGTPCPICDGVFSGWIDINDEKPPYLEEVIVARPNKHSGNVDIIIGKLHKAKLEGQVYGRIDEYKTTFYDYWSFPGIQPFEKVTHWMPLPIMPLKPENDSNCAQIPSDEDIKHWESIHKKWEPRV